MPPTKTTLLSFRVHAATKKAVEIAAHRDRRSLSNFIEVAVLSALPEDLRIQLEQELAKERGDTVVETSP